MDREWRDLLLCIPGYDSLAAASDCVFDPVLAQHPIDFFEGVLTHIEGKLAGQPFRLERWQKSILANLFGWRRLDGTRRYREALLYVPRKNGKTPLGAGLANYILFCDDECGQQDVCAAADREQAALLFRHVKGMIENESELSRRCTVFKGVGQRAIEAERGHFRVLSADADTKHGGNLHLAIIDELHAQPNRDLVDVLKTSMASANRRHPLLVYITTADFAGKSICNEVYEYACKVRDGVVSDPAFLPVIYETTLEDDWRDEAVWRKVNPNYGVSVSPEYMRRESERALESPAYLNTFLRLHLNMITEQETRWLTLDSWDACAAPVVPDELAGRPCYAGLDLSTTTDVSALVLVFPAEHEGVTVYDVLPYFWVPREGARRREKRDRVPYVTWIRDGYMTATAGDVVDYDVIRRDINALAERFNIRELAIDRWNATQLATQLQGDGLAVVAFGQGYASMSAPTKELEAVVLSGRLRHGGQPVLRWMGSNVMVEQDAAGNVKPSKAKSSERIDGIVALVMALGRATVQGGARPSVYETRGMVVL